MAKAEQKRAFQAVGADVAPSVSDASRQIVNLDSGNLWLLATFKGNLFSFSREEALELLADAPQVRSYRARASAAAEPAPEVEVEASNEPAEEDVAPARAPARGKSKAPRDVVTRQRRKRGEGAKYTGPRGTLNTALTSRKSGPSKLKYNLDYLTRVLDKTGELDESRLIKSLEIFDGDSGMPTRVFAAEKLKYMQDKYPRMDKRTLAVIKKFLATHVKPYVGE